MVITLNWLQSIPERVSPHFMAWREWFDERAESELNLVTAMNKNPNMSSRSWMSMLIGHYLCDTPFSHKSWSVKAKLLQQFPVQTDLSCFQ